MTSQFEFQKRLGSGYFGEVWLAFDIGLGMHQAVKLISPSKVINPKNIFQESQILKSAENPNVVKVIAAGIRPDGQIYVSMEYLPRGSVEDEAKGGYLHLTRAKRLMIDVLRGLEHAHSKGILHRDIKPANILIGESSEGKLSDFGLALPISELEYSIQNLKDYAYFFHQAPEVYKDRKYSIASDIYSCGITLYRLVNGDTYLPKIDDLDTLGSLIEEGKFPKRDYYRDFIPRSLKMVINKAMNLKPEDRFGSAQEMRHALEQVFINKNWAEKALPNGIKWTCSWKEDKYYEITKTLMDKKWSIIVKRGTSKVTARNDNKLSKSNLIKKEADSLAKRLLQDFVTGKLK